jgi:hypothetical protein
LAGGLVLFRAGEASLARFRQSHRQSHLLIAREKQGALNAEELAELNHYMQLEHIMRMAKARLLLEAVQ